MINAMPKRKFQSGAALVVGLILLVALTLMALASMNTASLDLLMVGNEQYRSQTFVAAEAGVERAFADKTLYSTAADSAEIANTTGGITVKYQVKRINDGLPLDAIGDNSNDKYKQLHFRITANGTGPRGNTTQIVQELFQVMQDDFRSGCNTALGACDLGTP